MEKNISTSVTSPNFLGIDVAPDLVICDLVEHLPLLLSHNSPAAIAIWSFVYAVLAPITEEIAFRGILHPALRRHWSRYPAMIFGSLIFALVHMEFSPWWMFHKFALGYTNVLLLEKTGSIVPGIVNHILLNSFVVCFLVICS